jgi:hypothetical protein
MLKFSKSKTQVLDQKLKIILIIWHINAKAAQVVWYLFWILSL